MFTALIAALAYATAEQLPLIGFLLIPSLWIDVYILEYITLHIRPMSEKEAELNQEIKDLKKKLSNVKRVIDE